jgi:hypothetical protein
LRNYSPLFGGLGDEMGINEKDTIEDFLRLWPEYNDQVELSELDVKYILIILRKIGLIEWPPQ